MTNHNRFWRLLLIATLFSTLAACGGTEQASSATGAAPAAQASFKWKMVTTWPKNFPGLGEAPEYFAERVERMSNGRLKISVYGAGELVPALEVFDAVTQGTAEMGHGAAYYWKGKVPAAQFLTSVPFGLTAQEINGWVYHGGGLEIWRELYQPFGVIPFPAGNTGVQMGGWFNKEINSLADLKGLKMRIPGLGGDVFAKAGGTPVNLAGDQIFTALQTGAIDATEWVGPYNDRAFGLHKAAKYYYYPGWHEPGSMLELLISEKAFNALPPDLQAIVEVAARMANEDMLALYTAQNNAALKDLVENQGVELRRYPDDVLMRLKTISAELLEELAAKDDTTRKVYESYKAFKQNVTEYHSLTEQAFINARD